MSAYQQGVQHRSLGKSINCNPFIHSDIALGYNMWRKGFLAI